MHDIFYQLHHILSLSMEQPLLSFIFHFLIVTLASLSYVLFTDIHPIFPISHRRLQDSERVALETEEQGAGILSSLRRQREQIENSRDVVRNISCFTIVGMSWISIRRLSSMGHLVIYIVPFASIFPPIQLK
jgi:Snare region anchored in the vesicle membrane C-terminus